MGLDMYLKKGKRIPKKSVKEIYELDTLLFNLQYNKEDLEANKEVKKYQEYIIDENSKYFGEIKVFLMDVAYWRKANAIHKWFVDNCQNGVDKCEPNEVTKENVNELLSVCREVLSKVEVEVGQVYDGTTCEMVNGKYKEVEEYKSGKTVVDDSVCEKLLPTQQGFFFGNVDYDEYYIDDVKNTIEFLEDVLKTVDFDNEVLVYVSSW